MSIILLCVCLLQLVEHRRVTRFVKAVAYGLKLNVLKIFSCYSSSSTSTTTTSTTTTVYCSQHFAFTTNLYMYQLMGWDGKKLLVLNMYKFLRGKKSLQTLHFPHPLFWKIITLKCTKCNLTAFYISDYHSIFYFKDILCVCICIFIREFPMKWNKSRLLF